MNQRFLFLTETAFCTVVFIILLHTLPCQSEENVESGVDNAGNENTIKQRRKTQATKHCKVICPFRINYTVVNYCTPKSGEIFCKVRISNIVSLEYTYMMNVSSYPMANKFLNIIKDWFRDAQHSNLASEGKSIITCATITTIIKQCVAGSHWYEFQVYW